MLAPRSAPFGAVARQVFLREGAGVLRRVDRESILLAELPDCGDAVGDGAVRESGGLGKDEHARLLRRCGDRDRGKEGEREGNEESVHGRQSAAEEKERKGGDNPLAIANRLARRISDADG